MQSVTDRGVRLPEASPSKHVWPLQGAEGASHTHAQDAPGSSHQIQTQRPRVGPQFPSRQWDPQRARTPCMRCVRASAVGAQTWFCDSPVAVGWRLQLFRSRDQSKISHVVGDTLVHGNFREQLPGGWHRRESWTRASCVGPAPTLLGGQGHGDESPFLLKTCVSRRCCSISPSLRGLAISYLPLPGTAWLLRVLL